ncbi:MAG: hypothetical protein V1725_02980 [archaeon]
MEGSVFRNALDFFVQLGIYDVVLPFLLVFTLVFAFLEKSRVYGTEQIGDKEYSRKNLNAMTAFVLAFLVVASSQLVAVINKALAHGVLLLILIFAFMLLAGSFHKQTKEGFFLEKNSVYYKLFMGIMFVGIILIFLNALGWLELMYNYLISNWSSTAVASIVLVIVMVGVMFYVVKEPAKEEKKEGE